MRAAAIAALAALALMASTADAQTTSVPPAPLPPGPTSGPLAGTGMWIWELGRSNGGNLDAIAARARAHGIGTLFVKSSDGTSWWPQFSSALVARLHSAGLRVCAWQYVYPVHAATDARLGVRAKHLGADCLVIDAESQYEGHYVQADTYIRHLRAGVGPGYPVALTSFPYVDYHPAFPYSVFLGPGGAQYNVPQMYWRAIGTSVDHVFTHSMPLNAVYDRPILPLGQLWENPSTTELLRFRQLSMQYGSTGVSWWDWQEASSRGFNAIARPLAQPASTRAATYPRLSRGARGDLVVEAQERLHAAGYAVPVNGVFGASTARAVRAFQAAGGLSRTGVLDQPTWGLLLRSAPLRPRWVARRSAAATAAGADELPPPASASLPMVRDELGSRHH